MASRLADRLHAARDQLFVGRTQELDTFQAALEAPEWPFFVLHVFGPGGVGKTSLLRAFRRQCAQAGVAAYYLDARDVEPTAASFRAALRDVCEVPDGEDVLSALADRAGRHVLFVDTWEAVSALDRWLREQFLPDLPDTVLVVLAGRDAPAQAWRADPGWQDLVEVLPLRNLDADAGRTFLQRRGIAEEQHDRVLTFTHGHPLATSLVADLMGQQPDQDFQPEQAPDVIKTLLEDFVQNVPGPAHRAALEACALVRFTTETLLQDLLELPDAHDLFEWLRGLSFIDAGMRGLFPHDLAREVLAADVQWRNPEWYAELQRRARKHYTSRLKEAHGVGDRIILSDYTFLLRDNPLVRPLVSRLRTQWSEAGEVLPGEARPEDREALAAMVRRHEGPESAEWFEHWFERQPDGITVYRDAEDVPQGFMATVTLDEADPDARAADPATRRAWAHLERQAPLRPGEHAALFRFWMAREAYQDVSPVQSLIFVRRVRYYLDTPGLAYTFLPCRDADLWGAIFTYAGMDRVEAADFEVGEHTYAVFGHDWRVLPPAAWLDLLAERGSMMQTRSRPEPSASVLVLSRSGFAEAVREALNEYTRPDRLTDNPLLRSRLVVEQVGREADTADRVTALRTLIGEAVDALDGDPRDAKYHRALVRTYIKPAPTQERAAEQLDLPYSTFRRHLKRGRERVVEILWKQEVGTGA
ncbi:MAG: AAA family ATPase [Bacteroidetes bacterium]|jgi:hypothetical protein|nr:AAA family ATPase [Bacteroidota bacterium]